MTIFRFCSISSTAYDVCARDLWLWDKCFGIFRCVHLSVDVCVMCDYVRAACGLLCVCVCVLCMRRSLNGNKWTNNGLVSASVWLCMRLFMFHAFVLDYWFFAIATSSQTPQRHAHHTHTETPSGHTSHTSQYDRHRRRPDASHTNKDARLTLDMCNRRTA